MKKIFQHSYVYDTDNLIAWEYEGYRIELDYAECRSMYNPYRRDGYLVPALRDVLGYCWFETLKEAKKYIDRYLLNKEEE